VHGARAGPWMGANGVAFGLFAVLVPITMYIEPNSEYDYFIWAGESPLQSQRLH
jgi:hypothetical protein